jgi:hypothetical protein
MNSNSQHKLVYPLVVNSTRTIFFISVDQPQPLLSLLALPRIFLLKLMLSNGIFECLVADPGSVWHCSGCLYTCMETWQVRLALVKLEWWNAPSYIMQIFTNSCQEFIRCCALVEMLQRAQMCLVDRSIGSCCKFDVFLYTLQPLVNTAFNLSTIRHLQCHEYEKWLTAVNVSAITSMGMGSKYLLWMMPSSLQFANHITLIPSWSNSVL